MRTKGKAIIIVLIVILIGIGLGVFLYFRVPLEKAMKHCEEGLELLEQNKLTQAKEQFELALKSKKVFGEVHLELGNIYLKEKRWKDAETEYNKSIEQIEKYGVQIRGGVKDRFLGRANTGLASIYLRNVRSFSKTDFQKAIKYFAICYGYIEKALGRDYLKTAMKIKFSLDNNKVLKTAVDTSRRRTKGNLATMRKALKKYSSDKKGKYPVKSVSKSLVPKYLYRIPQVQVPNHDYTNEIIELKDIGNRKVSISDFKDTGKWLYVADNRSPDWGKVYIDCTHIDVFSTDRKKKRWYE